MPNLTFHGPVPYHAVGEFFARARVFVGTSAIEGFPNTYLQAWAHGTPVVAFLDPQQLLARHALGRAVTHMEEMQAAISALNSDVQQWEAASERATQYMNDRIDEARMVAPYIEAFSTLLRAYPSSLSS